MSDLRCPLCGGEIRVKRLTWYCLSCGERLDVKDRKVTVMKEIGRPFDPTDCSDYLYKESRWSDGDPDVDPPDVDEYKHRGCGGLGVNNVGEHE